MGGNVIALCSTWVAKSCSMEAQVPDMEGAARHRRRKCMYPCRECREYTRYGFPKRANMYSDCRRIVSFNFVIIVFTANFQDPQTNIYCTNVHVWTLKHGYGKISCPTPPNVDSSDNIQATHKIIFG